MSEVQKPVYNNSRFRVVDYNFDTFVGPAAGDKYIDATFTDLTTNEDVKISDFDGKWLVIETGSSTCSMYTKNIGIYKDIVSEFSDVEFVMVYVREAHPGERMGPHQNMDDKFKAAYVIRPDGTIHYRCNWAAPHLIRAALQDRESYHKVENAPTAELRAMRSLPHMMRTMWTGGIVALYDFFKNGPLTVAKHIQIDRFYNKHGRFRNAPLSQEEIAERVAAGDADADKVAAPGEAGSK